MTTKGIDAASLSEEQFQENLSILGHYINPLSDWGFKKLFGSEINKELLLEFLNVIIDDKDLFIQSIQYIKTEHKGLTDRDRSAVFDISCKTDKGERFIVEMQNTSMTFFSERMLYYATFPVQEQAKKGKWDYSLDPVIMIGILNFSNPKHKEDDHNFYYYDIKERYSGEVMTDKLRFIVVEVEKFNKTIDENSSLRDKWLYVLKNMQRLYERPHALQAKIFKQLFDVAKVSALSRDEQINYMNAIFAENDEYSRLKHQKEIGLLEGEKIGIEKGERIGIEKGERIGIEKGEKIGMEKGIVNIAKNLKNSGFSNEVIAQNTGLSIGEIELL